MPYRERETEKVYFKIAEVAKMVNQATSALRFWEEEFDWLNPKKNKVGNRHYTKSDIQIVLDLNILINSMGMTSKGVKLAHNFGYIEDLKELYRLKIRQETKQKKVI